MSVVTSPVTFALGHMRKLHQRACAAVERLSQFGVSDADRNRITEIGREIRAIACSSLTPAAQIEAIHRVAVLVSEVERITAAATPQAAPWFSKRQRELLYWLGQGKTVSETAIILGISVKTASEHRVRLLRKLDFENNAQLIRYSIIEGIETV